MPDDYEVVRAVDFTFEDKEKYKANFSIEVLSHIPSFDSAGEIHSSSRIYDNNNQTEVMGDIGNDENGLQDSALLGNGMQHGLIVKNTNEIKNEGI
jgi:hypothetical protein